MKLTIYKTKDRNVYFVSSGAFFFTKNKNKCATKQENKQYPKSSSFPSLSSILVSILDAS